MLMNFIKKILCSVALCLICLSSAANWKVWDTLDEMTDEIKWTAGVTEKEGKDFLYIFCVNGEVQTAFFLDKVTAVMSPFKAQFRIGSSAAFDDNWRRVETNSIQSFEPEDFLLKLKGETKLLLRFKTFSEGYQTLRFDISGFDDAYLKVKTECNNS